MTTEHRHISEPGELIYRPRPSWAPAIFGFALALTVCGIFAEGFMVRGWIYSIIGGVIALFALRSMVKDATRSYFQLPRKQKVRGAVLPVEQISTPKG
jgi:CDP-diglyceride synthetase